MNEDGDIDDEQADTPVPEAAAADVAAAPTYELPAHVVGILRAAALDRRTQFGNVDADVVMRSGERIGDKDVSLVRCPDTIEELGEIKFVAWTNAATMEGRTVRLHRFGRLITIVAYPTPIQSYFGSAIIIPRTGALVVRAPPSGRLDMSLFARLRQMQEHIRQFNGPFRGRGDSASHHC